MALPPVGDITGGSVVPLLCVSEREQERARDEEEEQQVSIEASIGWLGRLCALYVPVLPTPVGPIMRMFLGMISSRNGPSS